MVIVNHYLYILSTWCLVAEEAIGRMRERFGSSISYDWHIACTDYETNTQLTLAQLEFYYARLEVATGQHMTTNWWYEGYDWLVPDRMTIAARRLGVTDNSVRLALSNAGLREGRRITMPDVALKVAAEAGALRTDSLRKAFDEPQTVIELFRQSSEFRDSGVSLRPALVISNDLGDRIILSGIWTEEPIMSAVEALLRDEVSYADFVRSREH